MAVVADAHDRLLRELPKVTGHPLPYWLALLDEQGSAKKGIVVALNFLRDEHGIPHEQATAIAYVHGNPALLPKEFARFARAEEADADDGAGDDVDLVDDDSDGSFDLEDDSFMDDNFDTDGDLDDSEQTPTVRRSTRTTRSSRTTRVSSGGRVAALKSAARKAAATRGSGKPAAKKPAAKKPAAKKPVAKKPAAKKRAR